MTVDLRTLKIGDTVQYRNGREWTVAHVESYSFYQTVYLSLINSDGETRDTDFKINGWWTNDTETDFDIVKIIPKEEPIKNSNISTIPGITGKGDYNPATAKTDTGKDRLDLLPYAGLASAAKAFEYGMSQYGHNNYRNAKSYRPFLAAGIRHIMKELDGEAVDKDSGLNHICHALACLLMAEDIKSQGKPLNDPDTMKPYGERNKPKRDIK